MALQILFLGNMCYIYGSVFRAGTRYQAFSILMVDFDGGSIGQSMIKASENLQGTAFPRVSIEGPEQQTPESVHNAVRGGQYWGAIYATHGASNRLNESLQGKADSVYNASDAIIYIWDEARYSPISDLIFKSSFQSLITISRLTWNEIYGPDAVSNNTTRSAKAVQTLLNPIAGTSLTIQVTEQTTKILYNSVSMVVPILSQFFFVMALNQISAGCQLYSKLPVRTSGILRIAISLLYTLVAALAMAGYIWAFREDWDVNGKQFCLTWMILWLLMDINFLLFDAATSIVPMAVMPFIVFTLIICSVTSTLTPFELNPGFYRWSYALPAHEVYTVLEDIWTRGAVPQLYHALPVLFSYWIAGWVAATAGHFRRCRTAKLNAIQVQWQNRDPEVESKPSPMVSLPVSERTAAAWDEEAARTPSEESLPQCLEQFPVLEEMRTRQRTAASGQ